MKQYPDIADLLPGLEMNGPARIALTSRQAQNEEAQVVDLAAESRFCGFSGKCGVA